MLFATLHITSNDSARLPEFLNFKKLDVEWNLVDDHSGRKARREQMHARLGTVAPGNIARFHWSLCSDGQVEDESPEAHISWVMSCFNENVNLGKLRELGFEFWFAYCWSGGGSGAGPSIRPELAKFLAHQEARLDIGFYAFDA